MCSNPAGNLGIKVKREELNDKNIQRISQLLNKTNQMNLVTRRMTEKELLDWIKQAGRKLWAFRVSDKFGDSGLTGIISLEVEKNVAKIADFLLSCRIIGRKVEEAMIHTAVEYARSRNLNEIRAKYIPTAKNNPCLEFWKKSGFAYNEQDSLFSRKVDEAYPLPECIHIEGQ